MTSSKNKKAKTNWLFLLHQLPTKSESERVRLWRSLQKAGVVSVKNSVAAAPDTAICRNNLLEIAQQITDVGGDAMIVEAHPIFGLETTSLEQSYNSQLDVEFKNLAKEIRASAKEISKSLSAADLMKWEHKRTKFQSKLNSLSNRSLSHLDGIDQCQSSLANLITKLKKGAPDDRQKSLVTPPAGATWVTRKNPHVDRLASAWLIKKFIDPKAEILFVDMATYSWNKKHVRFDVFNAEFGHTEDKCTFEVLLEHFKIKKSSVRKLGEIVHDLDIQDQKFDRRETEGIRMAIEGVIRAHDNDQERLANAMNLFDSLLLSMR